MIEMSLFFSSFYILLIAQLCIKFLQTLTFNSVYLSGTTLSRCMSDIESVYERH